VDYLALAEISRPDQFLGPTTEDEREWARVVRVQVERRVAVHLGFLAGGRSSRTSRVRSVFRLEPSHTPVPSGVITIGYTPIG
jgi:hypothetical protein